MLATQLDFFKTAEECEMHALRKRVNEIGISGDKVRKGVFAQTNQVKKECTENINEIRKECQEVKMRLEILERNICNGK